MSNIKNKNIGSTLESFLKEEGDYKEAQSTAIKRMKNMHKEMQENPERAALYLEEVLSGGDIEVFKLALKNVIDARLGGMTALSKLTGITKRTLVRTLSPEGILRFKTLTKILQAVGLRISVTPEGTPIPNADTIEAMEELTNGGGEHAETSEELYKKLGI